MYRLSKNILFSLLFISLLSFAAEAAEKFVVRVDGLSCAYCAYSLEKNLQKLDGVEKVEINLKDGVATLQLKEGAVLKEEVVEKTVKDAGFTPRSVKKVEQKNRNDE